MALITSKNREYFSQKLYDYSGLFYSRNDDLDYVLSDINGTELSVTWSEEEMFEYLDAPIVRVGSLDTPVPFSNNLEKGFLSNNRLKDKLNKLLNY